MMQKVKWKLDKGRKSDEIYIVESRKRIVERKRGKEQDRKARNTSLL